MSTTVGIPRALAYYDYYPFWQTFFSGIGVGTMVSPSTNKSIVNEGVRRAVDGTCFPVKILYGHVHWLMEAGVDAIFLPRLVSVAPREYICPKFMGLPDMVVAAFPERNRILSPLVNLRTDRKHVLSQMQEIGSRLGSSQMDVVLALKAASQAQREHEAKLQRDSWFVPRQESLATENHMGQDSAAKGPLACMRDVPLSVGLLGHSYLVYDEYANMGAISRLERMGVDVVTVDMLSPKRIDVQADRWPKRMFWTSGRKILGAAREYMEAPVAGIIYITAFACGTDSLTAELVERTVRRESKIPQLILNLDEHTGEAGVLTRLEAFVDMLSWRQRK